VKETPAACAQTRSEYYACAKSGPFTCTRLFGLTPEGCGLDKLNACLLTAGRACERWESLDGACRRDKGNDFLGFACRTDGDLPTGCVPTKASSEQAALRTACCPAATSGTP
jgi:hypothetical protein